MLENSNATPFRFSTLHGSFQCFCCFKPFLEMRLLREHTPGHTSRQLAHALFRQPNGKLIKVDVEALECSLCAAPLDDLPALKAHLSAAHGEDCDAGRNELLVPFALGRGGYVCRLCETPFAGFHALNQHMNVHFTNHVCDVCGAGYASSDRLGRHVNAHRSAGAGAALECAPCRLTFATRYRLECHRRQRHGKAPRHRCPRCPERFKDHYLRTEHMTRAHGVPAVSYACASCERTFARKGPLNAHVRQVHLKVRNHECDVCGHRFYQKSHLAKHMVSHSGEKNFRCELCGKAYTLKNNLTHHVRTHHRRERCSLCDEAFADRDKLKEHVKTHVEQQASTK